MSTILKLSCLTLLATLLGCDAPAPSEPEGTPAAAPKATAPTVATPASEGAPQAAARGPIAEALAIRDYFGRIEALAVLLPTLGTSAVPEAKEMLRQSRGRLHSAEFEMVMRYWATHEPAEASDWAIQYAPHLYQNSAIRTAVELWARSDPAEALAGLQGWAQTGVLDVAQSVQLALVAGWYQVDPEGVQRYIEGLGSGILQQRSIVGLLLAKGRAEGSDAIFEWAESLDDADERFKLAVYRQVATTFAWTDVDAAERWCDAHCDGPYGKGLRGALARARLSRGEDGARVVEWTASAPPETREHDLVATYSLWAAKNRAAALSWLEQKIADGEEWVPLLYGVYARHLAADDPAAGIPWAEKMPDEARRENTLVRVARKWLKEDPEAAEAWLAQSGLSEAARNRARDPNLPGYLPAPTERLVKAGLLPAGEAGDEGEGATGSADEELPPDAY